jgi:hypothetical protein
MPSLVHILISPQKVFFSIFGRTFFELQKVERKERRKACVPVYYVEKGGRRA